MKIKFLNLLLLLLLFTACKKERSEAQLIKKCNNVYMLIKGEYYQICNKDDFAQIPSGTELKIKYKIIEKENCEPIISCACCIFPFTPNDKIIDVKIIY